MGPPRPDPLMHVEKGPAEVYQLPREEQKDPCHGCVSRCAGTEDVVAGGRVSVVAVDAEVAVAKAEDDGGEGAEHAAGHENAVDDHVEHEFGGEDTITELCGVCLLVGYTLTQHAVYRGRDTYVLWRANKNVWDSSFKPETRLAKGAGAEKHPDDFDGSQQEH